MNGERSQPSRPILAWLALMLLTTPGSRLTAQSTDLARDRAEYATWLATAPFSPYAAVAMQPIGTGLVLGPSDADIPLTGVPATRVLEERNALYLEQGGARRSLPRNRAVPLGSFRLFATGAAGRAQLVVYGAPRSARPPAFYPPVSDLGFTVALDPPERRGAFRTLGLDGIETDASEAGFVSLPLRTGTVRLRVYRIGEEDEAELLVFFRDSTNGRGSYPAGRFVTLDPAGSGRYRVDLNRARNPFCAYNTVFPCPPPWPGNGIPTAIAAGERYEAKP